MRGRPEFVHGLVKKVPAFERDGKKVVYVVKDDTVREVVVTTGAKIGELVAVNGVNLGDTLVLAPNEKIRDGAKVTLAKK